MKLKILLSAFMMLTLVSSCTMCRKPIEEGNRTETPECGFGAEAMLDKVEIDNETAHTSPAAERRTNTSTFDEVTEDEFFAAESSEKSNDSKITKKNKRSSKLLGSKKKARIKDVIKAVKQAKKRSGDPVMLVLLVILAIILPPLAVGIFEGITGRFWLVLVLWLVGWGVGWWLLGPGLAGLCSLVAVILALLIVLGVW